MPMAANDPGLFINYRTEDSQAEAMRLESDLRRLLVHGHVFIDRNDLRAGEKWQERIYAEIDQTAVMLVLIGRQWLSARTHGEMRRLDDPHDWVRREIEYAFKIGRKVVPVLLNGTPLPPKEAFRSVPDLERLTALQTLSLQSDNWETTLASLTELLCSLGFQLAAEPRRGRTGSAIRGDNLSYAALKGRLSECVALEIQAGVGSKYRRELYVKRRLQARLAKRLTDSAASLRLLRQVRDVLRQMSAIKHARTVDVKRMALTDLLSTLDSRIVEGVALRSAEIKLSNSLDDLRRDLESARGPHSRITLWGYQHLISTGSMPSL